MKTLRTTEKLSDNQVNRRLKNAILCPDLSAKTKDALIKEMVDMIVAEGKIKNRNAVLQAVSSRAKEAFVGLQYGVAFLHGKADAVDDLLIAIGLKKEGTDFDSVNGEPSRIFVLIIHPPDQTAQYLQCLSALSKLLRRSQIREQLLCAGSKVDMVRILTQENGRT